MTIETKLNEFVSVPGFVCPAEFWAALGYEGEARYVGIWWEQCGDEASWSDGRSSFVGANWGVYLELLDHNFPLGHPVNWLLGESYTQASMWLIIDRVTEWGWLVPVEEAEGVLRMQYPQVESADPGESKAVSFEELMAMIDGMGGRESAAAGPVDGSDEDFARVMAEQYERDLAFRHALALRGRPTGGAL